MLAPRKVKHRKQHTGRMKGLAQRGNTLAFGEIGLKSLGRTWLSSAQIESARRAIRNRTKRAGKLWIRVFPSKPISKKPPEVRMGAGKGPLDHYAAVIKPGKILFEIAGVDEETARDALKLASHKLPIKTTIVSRETLIKR